MNFIEQEVKELRFSSLDEAKSKGYGETIRVVEDINLSRIDLPCFEPTYKLLFLRPHACPYKLSSKFFKEKPPDNFVHEVEHERVVSWWQYVDN